MTLTIRSQDDPQDRLILHDPAAEAGVPGRGSRPVRDRS